MEIIARVKTDFSEKFGIPRQSGIVKSLTGKIVFEPKYRNPDSLRGLDGFSHIWVLWEFSKMNKEGWSPTVRPPRLGGNTRMGVFATRSPNRPNPIGLSSVKLEKIELTSCDGPILHISGVDMLNDTPVYDIKPYLPFSDFHPEATGGFADDKKEYSLNVEFSNIARTKLSEKEVNILTELLAEDPRPSYQDNPDREYGMKYADMEIKFKVEKDTLYVYDILKGTHI